MSRPHSVAARGGEEAAAEGVWRERLFTGGGLHTRASPLGYRGEAVETQRGQKGGKGGEGGGLC